MTDRKPPGMKPEDWVRHQIDSAEARGSFRDLPSSGRPLPAEALRLDRDWVGELIRREQLDASVLLPVSITLAREVEQLPGRLAGERSERRVREIVVDLDERIRDAYRRVLTGPPMRTMPLDVDTVVDRWRASRPPDPLPAARARDCADEPVSATAPIALPSRTGRWFALRSRRRRASVLGNSPLDNDDERSPT